MEVTETETGTSTSEQERAQTAIISRCCSLSMVSLSILNRTSSGMVLTCSAKLNSPPRVAGEAKYLNPAKCSGVKFRESSTLSYWSGGKIVIRTLELYTRRTHLTHQIDHVDHLDPSPTL